MKTMGTAGFHDPQSVGCAEPSATRSDSMLLPAPKRALAVLASLCLLTGCGDSQTDALGGPGASSGGAAYGAAGGGGTRAGGGNVSASGGGNRGDGGNVSTSAGGTRTGGGNVSMSGGGTLASGGRISESGGLGGAALGGGSSVSGAPTAGKSSTIGGAAGGPSVAGCRIFPADNAWNRDVSALPLHPRSQAFIESIGAAEHMHPDFGTVWEGAPIGIPYVTVDSTQPKLPIQFEAYGDESDQDPYPIPGNAPVEGGPTGDGDRHVIVVETSSCRVYELFRAFPIQGTERWRADSGAIYDLSSNAQRPLGWTSADAAGLPIFPGLVRYDEVVEKRVIEHALRFTVARSQAAIVAPARHFASSSTDPNLPPMGLRLRMKAAYDVSAYSAEAKVVCAALKRFGMIVADNGSNWYLSGAPDPRWNDDALSDLKKVPGSAFEVVDTGPIETY